MRRRIAALAAVILLCTAAGADAWPADLTVIESEAFTDTDLTEIRLPDTLRVIGPRAFSSRTIRHVTLPASVRSIDATAFDGTADGFFVTVAKDSYAESWCKAHDVRFSYTDVWYVTPEVTAESFSKQGTKYLGLPYSAMDCQAFVEACLKDAGIRINLAGSNAWYRAMDWVGTPEQCVALFGRVPKGAFLFIHAYDGGEPAKYRADGLGNASHIGICTRTGKGAIHSSKSKGGVYESAFADRTINGGWNCVGLWRQLDYGDAINSWLASHP